MVKSNAKPVDTQKGEATKWLLDLGGALWVHRGKRGKQKRCEEMLVFPTQWGHLKDSLPKGINQRLEVLF